MLLYVQSMRHACSDYMHEKETGFPEFLPLQHLSQHHCSMGPPDLGEGSGGVPHMSMEGQEKETGLQVYIHACVGKVEGVPHPVKTNRPSG